MGKLIFFDVDGTLFRHDCQVPESTVRAIKKLDKAGHVAMVCTGRGACTLPEAVEALPLHGGVRGCGTYVSIDDRILVDEGVSGRDVKRIIDIMRSYGYPYFIENSDRFLCEPEAFPENFREMFDRMKTRYPGRFRHVSETPSKIAKMTAYPSDDRLPQFIEDLSEWFNVITHEEYEYAEIIMKGYSKGTGVRLIMSELGISKEDTYGFGDSGNDIAMLDEVGTAIVMGDAPDYLKEKYIPTASIYDDGIEKALIQLGLI